MALSTNPKIGETVLVRTTLICKTVFNLNFFKFLKEEAKIKKVDKNRKIKKINNLDTKPCKKKKSYFTY